MLSRQTSLSAGPKVPNSRPLAANSVRRSTCSSRVAVDHDTDPGVVAVRSGVGAIDSEGEAAEVVRLALST
jgi:hypothetical protein